MASQTLVWIALPDGFAPDGSAKVSVVVSPRLVGDDDSAVLGAFDLADWPARIADGRLAFDVLAGDVRLPARVTNTLDPARWRALLPSATLVRSHAAQPMSGVVGTYPAARVRDRLKAGYQKLGRASALQPPSRDAIAAAFPELHAASRPIAEPVSDTASDASDSDRRAALARANFSGAGTEAIDERLVDLALGEALRLRADRAFGTFVPIVPEADDDPVLDFAQAAVFLRQPGGSPRVRQRRANDERIDFHQRVATLAEYPALARTLGLLLDLVFDAGALGSAGRMPIRVVPRSLDAFAQRPESVSPTTACVFERGTRFAAAARASGPQAELRDGLLVLAPDRFDLVQIDVDSAALRTIAFVGEAARGSEPAAAEGAPPALRTGGIALVRRGHARALHDGLASTYVDRIDAAAADKATYFAEDLVGGLRIDVQHVATGRWHSLHERQGRYAIDGTTAPLEARDESSIGSALVQPAAVGKSPPTTHDPDAPAYVAESIARWEGWSLAVPRPAKVLPSPVDAPANLQGADWPLLTTFERVPGSLPRLRFGSRYRLRARIADLAGNGLGLAQADALRDASVIPAADPGLTFRRFEPVSAPLVVPRAPLRQGETVERIVLRSRPEASADDYASEHPEVRLCAERHIAPAAVAQIVAEWSGLFDAAIGPNGDAAAAFALLAREQAQLNDVEPAALLTVPFLPDPLAMGAALHGLPGLAPGAVSRVRDGRLVIDAPPPGDATTRRSATLIGFDGAWPARRGFRLRLVEGDGPPRWDDAERALVVALAKGASHAIGVSAFVEAGALPSLGLWQWTEEGLDDVRREALHEAAQLGRLWMLTPSRELTLTHAVTAPASAPVIESFGPPTRLTHATHAHVIGRVRVHAASTGHIELLARWTEVTDDPNAPTTERSEREAPVAPAPLVLGGATPPVAFGDPVPPARFDPATGLVVYQGPLLAALEQPMREAARELDFATQALMRALDRLRPPADERVAQQVREADGREGVRHLLSMPPLHAQWASIVDVAGQVLRDANELTGSVSDGVPFPPDVTVPTAIQTAARPVIAAASELQRAVQAALDEIPRYQGRHHFGDTRHRRVAYRVLATTRFAECFPAAITDRADQITRTSAAIEIDVPSSSRPPPPRIRHVVPAARWSRAPDAPRHRFGGGLRVVLERPWFSSGEGEQLGVVLGPPPDTLEFDRIEPFVSQWGRDPIRLGAATPLALAAEHFRNAAAVHRDIVSPDLAQPVTIVAYPVTVADGRAFCDIEIDPGDAYYPFVRLALVRFQPHSIEGLECSPSALADFAQLAPDRTVSVVRVNADVFELTISGATHQSIDDPADPRTGNRYSARIQSRIDGTRDDAGWVAATEGSVEVLAVSAPSNAVLWQARVTLPAGRPSGRFRVLIDEREVYETVDPATDSRRLAERVVFADALAL